MTISAWDKLQQTIRRCYGPDRAGLRRLLQQARRRQSHGQDFDRALDKLDVAITQSLDRVARREQHRPRVPEPPDLPIADKRDAIRDALSAHQVIVVCGETGSGKSTQLPQILLEAGYGVRGMIAHTQPRRIAARTLAKRIAEEMGEQVGGRVGFKVRFSDHTGDDTRVKLITDGMLLAETQSDRSLEQYDAIIIDEAHERSLNIDFLLGYLKQRLAERTDLKLVITSATIDPERFSRHFDDAPIIEVSGRTYPVEQRYRPLADERGRSDRNLYKGILDAVDELSREGPGDILVFLSGEREIREAAEHLRKHHPKHTEILPLFSRLSAREQERVFSPHGGRRVVLATNVAETSLTVPGIRYVVDAGTARISRYSYRTKVQRLPVEPISQASAKQRAGRCGRVGPGICIRLYSEDDFANRPEFTDPEILRTNLAAVILQMKASGLGDIEAFPFVERPDTRFINDGIRLLHEIRALEVDESLSAIGRDLARLPIDPRLARLLVAGRDRGCLGEMLVLAAFLSIQDPRERPLDAQQAADEAHAQWLDPRSDFVGVLKLWRDVSEQWQHLSRKKFQQWAREQFLAFMRVLEWRDLHRQLKEQCRGSGWTANEQPADEETLHTAVLDAFCGQVASRDEEGGYVGPRNLKLRIHPASALAKKKPAWLVSAEIVETRQTFARLCAEVQPAWIERAAAHLLKRQYADPHWQPRRGRVAAFETVTLYGLVLASGRKVDFSRIDPVVSREIFIREGLVGERMQSKAAFFAHNQALRAEVEAEEAKTRRRDLLSDEQTRFDFYDARIPAEVTDLRRFERWRKQAEADDPKLLFFGDADVRNQSVGDDTDTAFPSHLSVQGLRLPVSYQFEPGSDRDGLTVRVPLAALNQLEPGPFEWLVPGMLEEKIVALIKSLPKRYRRHMVPAPDFARAVMDALGDDRSLPLLDAVRGQLTRMTGLDIPADIWSSLSLPNHLSVGFALVDADGEQIAYAHDLRELQATHGEHARQSFQRSSKSDWERTGLKRWDMEAIPEEMLVNQAGVQLKAYPALEDKQQHVDAVLADDPAQAWRMTRAGVRRLFMLHAAQQMKYLKRQLPDFERTALAFRQWVPAEELREDILAAAVEARMMPDGDFPRSREVFEQRYDVGRAALAESAEAMSKQAAEIGRRLQALQSALKATHQLPNLESVKDVTEQVARLIYPGFLTETLTAWRAELPRYLDGMINRLERIQAQPGRDKAEARLVADWQRKYEQRLALHRRKGIRDEALAEFRWMLEEYRISLFAQPMKTRMPVSEKRLGEAWKRIV